MNKGCFILFALLLVQQSYSFLFQHYVVIPKHPVNNQIQPTLETRNEQAALNPPRIPGYDLEEGNCVNHNMIRCQAPECDSVFSCARKCTNTKYCKGISYDFLHYNYCYLKTYICKPWEQHRANPPRYRFYKRTGVELACVSEPCKNKAVCWDEDLRASTGGKGFTCVCPPLYAGKLCDKRDHCYSQPCKNNGICTNGDFGFGCTCKRGFSGHMCQYGNRVRNRQIDGAYYGYYNPYYNERWIK